MKPNKQIYIDFIISELNSGNAQYKDVLVLFVTKFDLTKQTFVRYWKKANEAHRIARESINSAKIEQTIIEEKEAVRIQIKSKLQRLEIYQKEIENSLTELSTGMTVELRPNGELVQRPLTISERSMLRKIIKDLQSEISKIEGDYAPNKTALTDTEGNDKKLSIAGFIIENE
jgi:transcriptional regulator of heat shock response